MPNHTTMSTSLCIKLIFSFFQLFLQPFKTAIYFYFYATNSWLVFWTLHEPFFHYFLPFLPPWWFSELLGIQTENAHCALSPHVILSHFFASEPWASFLHLSLVIWFSNSLKLSKHQVFLIFSLYLHCHCQPLLSTDQKAPQLHFNLFVPFFPSFQNQSCTHFLPS